MSSISHRPELLQNPYAPLYPVDPGFFPAPYAWHERCPLPTSESSQLTSCTQRTRFDMEAEKALRPALPPTRQRADALGIVITDGGLGARSGLKGPCLRAFIYGEEPEAPPTLPFGRWKEAS